MQIIEEKIMTQFFQEDGKPDGHDTKSYKYLFNNDISENEVQKIMGYVTYELVKKLIDNKIIGSHTNSNAIIIENNNNFDIFDPYNLGGAITEISFIKNLNDNNKYCFHVENISENSMTLKVVKTSNVNITVN